jgi:class 3 adenylate cyclase
LIDPKIAAHSGRLIKTMGDGLLVEFSRAVDALCDRPLCRPAWASGILREGAGSTVLEKLGAHIKGCGNGGA